MGGLGWSWGCWNGTGGEGMENGSIGLGVKGWGMGVLDWECWDGVGHAGVELGVLD